MLEIKNMYVSFTKEYYTINDLSLTVRSGEKLIIVGHKESGRTAVLRATLGLEPMAKGEVFFKGIPLSKIDFESDVSVGYLPANPSFLEKKTVEENVEYIVKLRCTDKSLVAIKTQNALVEYGLDFIKNKKVKDLSYYDRLKLALARLTTRNLDVLLIDDVFSPLSSMEKEKLIKAIKELVKTEAPATLIMVDNDEVADKFGYNKKYLIYGSLKDTSDFDL